MQLGDIARLTAGVITGRVLVDARKDKDESTGFGIRVLVPKAIHDGKVDHSLLESQELQRDRKTGEEKNVDNFRTKEGDIVIKLSSPYDSCIINREDEGLLVPSFCLRITDIDEEKVDRYFLLAYFHSKTFLEEIRKKCYGNVMALAKKSDFEKISVPDIPLCEQTAIGERFRRIGELKEAVRRYSSLEEERLDRILEEARKC